MSEPLIEKLRAQRNNGLAGALCGVAADRIVALEAERDALRQMLQAFVDLMVPVILTDSLDGPLVKRYQQLYTDVRALLSKGDEAKPSPSVSLPGWAKGENP